MNAIQMRERVDNLIDRTRTARHSDNEYYSSINNAITQIVKDRVAPIRQARRYSMQSAQRIKDELYPLIPAPATGAPSGDDVPYPNDYLYFLLLYATIDGEVSYCRPTTYNQVALLDDNPFKQPTALKPYYNENSSGIRVKYGNAQNFTAYELWYVKNPSVVTIGKESDKVTAGQQLTAPNTYMVYEEAVYNTVIYYPGEIITGTNLNLTSGIVIPTSVITSTELPVNMHEEICIKAAALLEGTVEDYNKKQDLNIETEKS